MVTGRQTREPPAGAGEDATGEGGSKVTGGFAVGAIAGVGVAGYKLTDCELSVLGASRIAVVIRATSVGATRLVNMVATNRATGLDCLAAM